MVRSKSIPVKELVRDNPTLCLSPNRVFEQCYRCKPYINAQRTGRALQCNPRISEHGMKLMKKRNKLIEERNRINKDLDEINKELI